MVGSSLGRLSIDDTTKHQLIDHEYGQLSQRSPSVAMLSPKEDINPPDTSPVVVPPTTNGKGPSKILFLDGVRGLAAILVVTQHSSFMSDLNLGAIAVDVFFVLSSFLLTMIFERKARQLLQQKASYRKWFFALLDYFTKRFLRVYPLFACVAIFLAFLSDNAKSQYYRVGEPEKFNLLKVLLFFHDYQYHAFWTLPVEISYYFLIPVFVFIILALRKFWWIIVIPLYVWIIYAGGYVFRTSHQSIVAHIPTFIAGSLAAIIYARIDQHVTKHQIVFQWWHKACIRIVEYTALAFILSIGFQGLFFHWVAKNPLPQPSGGFPFVSVYATTIILAEMIAPSAVSQIFEWNILRYSGKVSFSMYLLHSFVIYNNSVRHQRYYDKLFGQFFLLYILSTMSYYAIEYPAQQLAIRLSKYYQQLADPPKPNYVSIEQDKITIHVQQ